MSTLIEKTVRVNRILTTSMDHARAIDDPARAQVVRMLYRKMLSAEQITKELHKSGHKKALTTVRHHLDILKESGLIEVARIVESRGAITKFYSTSTKLLGYDAPKDFDAKYSKVINSTSAKVERILRGMHIDSDKKSKNADHDEYSQYIAMEIMNRAMTNVFENYK